MGDKKSVLDGKYELGRVLGHGSFGKVYQARNVESGKSVAMKVVAKEKVIKAGMMSQMEREISVMKLVEDHPNIVSLHEVMATKSQIYLAMDLVRGGELFARVQRGRLPEDEARLYFRQLISAVDFCHTRGVFHRDLKPENLLLDDKGTLKVTDFGLGAVAARDGLLRTACGTPAYAAPEVVGRGGYHGGKADLWSCGVVLYVLLAGFLPFRDGNAVTMYRKMHCGDFKCPTWFSPGARRLVRKLLDPNPDSRITIAKVMESSWFNKPDKKLLDLELELELENLECLKEPEELNAFHIISMSEGLDLSPLVLSEKKREEEVRLVTMRPVSSVMEKLEEVGKAMKLRVVKSERRVRLEGEKSGRKGKLAIAADIMAVTPELVVVEVTKEHGDTLEYNHFCTNHLRPALKDMV